MDRLHIFLATGCYSGYLPKAPGTWGSLVGIVLWVFLCQLPLLVYLCVVTVLFFVGAASAHAMEKITNSSDPGLVVIDEIVGQLITLSAAPCAPLPALAGFVLFRFFDILKPAPVNWIDARIHGGLGIMLDDVVAGLYGLLGLNIGLWLLG